MSTTSSTPGLRDHLLASLSTLPNTQNLHITALSSAPKRTTSLFPHAIVPPRCFQIDYFVVLGTEIELPPGAPEPTTTVSSTSETAESAAEHSTSASSSKSPTFVLTSAISAHLYILPHSQSSILYISKVDSSSYPSSSATSSTPNLPLTRTLISSFISYFLLPSSRPTPNVRIQLFARSQGQYLFPNSEQGKKGLGGARLCGWWKGVYEDVARILVGPDSPPPYSFPPAGGIGEETNSVPKLHNLSMIDNRVPPTDIHLAYLLPSYSSLEAIGILGLPREPLPPGLEWKYEPPFSSHWKSGMSLADIIPSLEDDPKTRFLEEVANATGHELGHENGSTISHDKGKSKISPKRPPPQPLPLNDSDQSSDRPRSNRSSSLPNPPSPTTPLPSLPSTSSVTASQLMQSPGTLISTQKPFDRIKDPKPRSSQESEVKIRAANEDESYRRQAHGNLSRISLAEFWERIGYRGECAGDTTGFFTLAVSPTSSIHPDLGHSSSSSNKAESPSSASTTTSHPISPDPSPARGHLSQTILNRIQKALMNTDFSTLEWATQGSEDWLASTKQIISGEIGQDAFDMYCSGIVPGKNKKEVDVMNRMKKRGREAEVVTVLQPRKKKKL